MGYFWVKLKSVVNSRKVFKSLFYDKAFCNVKAIKKVCYLIVFYTVKAGVHVENIIISHDLISMN